MLFLEITRVCTFQSISFTFTFQLHLSLFYSQNRPDIDSLLDEISSTASTSSTKRTFNGRHRQQLIDFWKPLFEKGKFLSGNKIDMLISKKFPIIFKAYGSKKIRAKYRDLKASFLRKQSKSRD